MSPAKITRIIMIALLVWGLWIASGALTHNQGILKSAIIGAFVALFLIGWLALLSLHARRSSAANTQEDP